MECCNKKSLVIGIITGFISGMLIASVMIIAASNLIMAQINNNPNGIYQNTEYRKNSMIHRQDSTPAPTDDME
ncbi:MAG: hypothetical protein HFE51_10860 [Clostridia bacterium]|nr:hypothetical protein [Clostridia bacterium]